jgi:hypothetical protein
VCRDCENIGRSSNKVLKNVIKKGDIEEGEWVDIRAEDGIDRYSEHVLGLWTEVRYWCRSSRVGGEANYAAFASGLEEDQMDGAEGHSRLWKLTVLGFDTGFIQGSLCEDGGLRKPSLGSLGEYYMYG